MAKMSCFSTLLAGGRKKRAVGDARKSSGSDCPKVKPVEFIDAPVAAAAKCSDKVAPCDVEVVAVKVTPGAPAAHVGGEKHGVKAAAAMEEECLSDFDFEFPAREKSDGGGGGGEAEKGGVASAVPVPRAVIASGAEEEEAVAADASAKLKRSCSNIEAKRGAPEMPARSRSYGDLRDMAGGLAVEGEATPRGAAEASPSSVKTSRTADRVMLKKRSSSQVLPSRSRKLWWRLFLWSHRNLHRPRSAFPASAGTRSHRHGGYTSDTLEEGATSAAADRKNKNVMVDDEPPAPAIGRNQWVAFSADNSLGDRVSAWVNSIETEPPLPIAEDDDNDDDDDITERGDYAAARPRALEVGESSTGKCHGASGKTPKRCTAADDVAQANSIIHSLNAFSSVAHISGMGLKVVPMIAAFSSLRAVNLSSNFIVHISPGSLPKGLHSLDLSRNKIANIEGLRELTKLRVLNLSYNRISRIGHGLSSCTAIRELYLAGNKLSDVEGLHRLLKLAVLDLGFNRVTTTKALGQLVANYHSLLALNLVGNPVQANVGDDALRKAVAGLLPQLAYLNKQPVNAQRARELAATDAVARAALGADGGRSAARRRAPRRQLGQSAGSSSSSAGRSRSRSKSKGRR